MRRSRLSNTRWPPGCGGPGPTAPSTAAHSSSEQKAWPDPGQGHQIDLQRGRAGAPRSAHEPRKEPYGWRLGAMGRRLCSSGAACQRARLGKVKYCLAKLNSWARGLRGTGREDQDALHHTADRCRTRCCAAGRQHAGDPKGTGVPRRGGHAGPGRHRHRPAITGIAHGHGHGRGERAGQGQLRGEVNGGGASVAISIHRGQAIAYVCNGSVIEAWLKGTQQAGISP